MKNYLDPKKYFDFVVNHFIEILSPVISTSERQLIDFYGGMPLKHQPVFIIGAPRTGSTILYQTLTNAWDVLYIDNLVCRFHRNLFSGFWLSNKFYGTEPHNSFKSRYGRTKGEHSPSECGQFWYRWLSKDRHFIDFQEITVQMVKEIQREITAVTNYFDKPIVFKNLNAGQRLRLLTKCFPDAKFLFLTREPLYTAQDILKVKREIGLSANTFWSIMPPNVRELKDLAWDEQIVKQVYFIEKQIVKDSSLAGNGNFYTVHYKNLSLQYINTLARKLGFKKMRDSFENPHIYINEKNSIGNKEFEQLETQVKTLDWSFLKQPPLSRSSHNNRLRRD